jgi:hypothetical protein
MNLYARRRISMIKKALSSVLKMSYPCDHEDEQHYVSSMLDEMRNAFTYVIVHSQMNGSDVVEIVKAYLIDEIKEHYIEANC